MPRQPALHDVLLRLLGGTLGALGNSNHDMAKGFLSIAVQAGLGAGIALGQPWECSEPGAANQLPKGAPAK